MKMSITLDKVAVNKFRKKFGSKSLSAVLNLHLHKLIRDIEIMIKERIECLEKLEELNRNLGKKYLFDEINSFFRMAKHIYDTIEEEKQEEIEGLLYNLFLQVFRVPVIDKFEFKRSLERGKLKGDIE